LAVARTLPGVTGEVLPVGCGFGVIGVEPPGAPPPLQPASSADAINPNAIDFIFMHTIVHATHEAGLKRFALALQPLFTNAPFAISLRQRAGATLFFPI
jgi:hypothetical protein